jgi:hypothetical protein
MLPWLIFMRHVLHPSREVWSEYYLLYYSCCDHRLTLFRAYFSSDLDNLATPFHELDELDRPLNEYNGYNELGLNNEKPKSYLGGDLASRSRISDKKAVMFYSVNSPHPGLSTFNCTI